MYYTSTVLLGLFGLHSTPNGCSPHRRPRNCPSSYLPARRDTSRARRIRPSQVRSPYMSGCLLWIRSRLRPTCMTASMLVPRCLEPRAEFSAHYLGMSRVDAERLLSQFMPALPGGAQVRIGVHIPS